MKPCLLLILLQITSSNSILDIKETSNKIKVILNKYKTTLRYRRSANESAVSHFAASALSFFRETERYGDFLRYLNVSECRQEKGTAYDKRHIFDALLIDHDVPDSHWNEYKSVFNKKYLSTHHEMAALTNWRGNLRHVARHNREYLAGTHSYSLHLNILGDFGPDDYMKYILKLIDTAPLHDPNEDKHKSTYQRNLHRKIPRHVDWRSQGFHPRKEQQLHCGACYAFAVTHAIQAQLYKKHRDWTELSAQQIVDCSNADGNVGCEGGSLRAALRYATRVGLHTEKDYPYKGKQGLCHSSNWFPRVKPRRWSFLDTGDEEALERALVTIGPLAVAVNASPRSFQLYRSGIYDDPFCIPWGLNHAMLLVGYTPQYWVLLNWWGPHWGEDGYIRIRRGFNRCGVANMAAYVEL